MCALLCVNTTWVCVNCPCAHGFRDEQCGLDGRLGEVPHCPWWPLWPVVVCVGLPGLPPPGAVGSLSRADHPTHTLFQTCILDVRVTCLNMSGVGWQAARSYRQISGDWDENPCMYMCACVVMHVYACIYVCKYVCACVKVYVWKCKWIYVCMNVYICKCACMCMHVWTNPWMYVSVYVCACICL